MLFLLYIFRKFGEFFAVNGKVLVTLHIVYVKINTVQRNLGFVIAVNYIVNGVVGFIAPAALLVSECPKTAEYSFCLLFS